MTKPKPNQISSDVEQWRKNYRFLPTFLRDFHDQKDLFKTMHERMDVAASFPYEKDAVNWISGHCYVIDIFLWFMARHGYTLQKSRKKLNFNDIQETLKEGYDMRAARFDKMLSELSKEHNESKTGT